MWRLLRARKPISILAAPSLANQVQSGQYVYVQRVRFGKGSKRFKYALVTVGLAWVCLEVYGVYIIDPLSRAVKEASTDVIVPNEDPTFWSFPWTLKAIPQQPYRGTDPEWQTYMKLNSDQELQIRIRNELAEIVRTVASNSPLLVQRCGKNWRMEKYWLSVDYPYAPPHKYSRKGIEFTEEGVSVKEREIDPDIAQNISRLLFPAPLAMSLFSFGSTLWKQNYQDLKTYFGIQPGHTGGSAPQHSTHSQQIQKAIGNLQQQGTKDPSAANSKRAMEERTAPDSAARSTPTPRGTPATPSAPANSPPSGGQTGHTKTAPRQPPPPKADPALDNVTVDLTLLGRPWGPMRQHIDGAWNNFKKTLAARSRRPPHLHTSGSILVSGIVELDTDKAHVLLDVYSFWDPKTRKYDYATMRMSLRRMKLKQQRPLR